MNKSRHNAMYGAPAGLNTATKPGSSLFLGDPVALPSETVGEMIASPSPAAAEASALRAVESARGEEAAEEYASMGSYDRMAATQFPILAVNNGTLSQTPIDRSLNAGNVNFNVQQLMNTYPIPGRVVSEVADALGEATITLDAAVAAAMGVTSFVVPFLILVIAASTIDAAPGAPITISVTGETESGETLAADDWTVERNDVTKAVTILLTPYRVIANRPLPANGFVDAVTSFVVSLAGLKEGQTVSAKVMGYAMNELTEIGRKMGLPAAIVK